jgi:hypothetical protein
MKSFHKLNYGQYYKLSAKSFKELSNNNPIKNKMNYLIS